MYAFSKEGNVYLPTNHNGRIVLCMDDEPFIRETVAESLYDEGFGVRTVEDSKAGLDVFKRHDDISLVISDILMPCMTGVEAYREMRKLRPVPALFMTGYAEKELLEEIASYGLDVLRKPFRLNDLFEKTYALTGLRR